MAQLFIQDASHLWSVLPLAEDIYRLSLPSSLSRPTSKQSVRDKTPRSIHSRRTPLIEPESIVSLSREGALLLRSEGAAGDRGETEIGGSASPAGWAVLAGPDTRLCINGLAIAAGIAALRHRDGLCLDGGAPLYFSTERLVRIETYRAADAPGCPRCTLPIELGDACVRCPGCNVLHHQRSDRACWTYSPNCARCDQSSDLEAGFSWSPEDL